MVLNIRSYPRWDILWENTTYINTVLTKVYIGCQEIELFLMFCMNTNGHINAFFIISVYEKSHSVIRKRYEHFIWKVAKQNVE